jgi:hypothetical protein
LNTVKQGHFPSVFNFILGLVQALPFDLPQGSFIVLLHDGYFNSFKESLARVPIFAFARPRTEHRVMLMPDPVFTQTNAYAAERIKLSTHSESSPWQSKKPAIFWRGGANGVSYFGEKWRDAPRVRLCLESKRLSNKALFDASITSVSILNQDIAAAITNAGLCASSVPFDEFYNYKHLIDIDGEHCTWQSHFMKLASDSTFIKVESPLIQWYHDRLKPWGNYIPIAPDLSDLPGIVEWVHAHDIECRRIATAGLAEASTITLSHAALNFGYDLKNILAARRG